MVRFRLWRNLSDESGLTLIELLGVALIMLLLALLAIPVYAGVTDQARFTQSMANLRNIEQALERHKAERGHYPDDLDLLVTGGFLKPTSFESAWSSQDLRIYLFYAVDRPDRPQAYALADPGPDADMNSDCKLNSTASHDATLSRDVHVPFPCGLTTHKARHWIGSAKPPLLLEGKSIPDSLSGYRKCDLSKQKKIAAKVQCVYKAEK